jgi:hypothetical protein
VHPPAWTPRHPMQRTRFGRTMRSGEPCAPGSASDANPTRPGPTPLLGSELPIIDIRLEQPRYQGVGSFAATRFLGPSVRASPAGAADFKALLRE